MKIDAVSESQRLLAQGFDALVDTLNNAPTMQVSTSSVISTLEVPAAVDGIQVMGASSTADGQAGVYTRVTASGALTITSADGAFWDPVAPNLANVTVSGTITCADIAASGTITCASITISGTATCAALVASDVIFGAAFISAGDGGVLMFIGTPLASTSGALTATLTNSFRTGNPTKWVSFDDGGTVRWFPTWD